MNKSFLPLVSALLVFTVALTACAPVPEPTAVQAPMEASPEIPPTGLPAEEPLVVVDDLGTEMVLTGPAQRIISISPSLTEILFGVGAGDRLVGRDSNSTYPEAALEVADLGGMWDGIPVEDILALEPDLILAGEIHSAEAVAELRELGLVVYWQANPDDFGGLYKNIKDIAALAGTGAEADQLIASLQERVTKLQQELQDVAETPLVFYELDASDPANPWTAGAGTFISYVISQAKGRNLGDSLDGDWVQISSEALVAQNPDYILLADALYGITPESLAERAGWGEISAVVNGEVHPFDPFILSVPGPRLVDGFEQLAAILHPGVVE